jgi:hypothetical protein
VRQRIFILLLLVHFSCECEEIVPEENSIVLCGVEDPANNLAWLKNLISDIKSDPKYVAVTITAWQYRGQTIFYIYDAISSCAFCDLRSCNGQKFSPSDFNDFMVNKKNEKKIWCQNADLCLD